MTLTLESLSSAGMFEGSTVDAGPFPCPVCHNVSVYFQNTLEGWCHQCEAVTGIPFAGPGPKVLVVGDTHGRFPWMVGSVIPYAKSAGCTRIMQVGDFGFVWQNDIDEVNRELDWLHGALEQAGLTLVFLPGNHENHPMLQRLSEAAERNEDGHYVLRPTIAYTGRVAAWTWDGLRMAAVGGANSIDKDELVPGESWWPEETLQLEEVDAAVKLGPVDILFTHDAPTGVPIPLMPDLASTVHRAFMSKIGETLMPALWFHGHYHRSMFYKFQHMVGATTVRGLHCNHARSHAEAMVAINLRAIRERLGAGRIITGELT